MSYKRRYDDAGNQFQRKKQKTTSWPINDQSKIHVGKGLALYQGDDNRQVAITKGEIWTNSWKDKRDYIERLLFPSNHGMGGGKLTNIICASGQQERFEIDLCVKADLLAMFQCLYDQMFSVTDGNNNAYVLPEPNGITVGVPQTYQTYSNANQFNTKLNIPLGETKMFWHNGTNANCEFTLLEFTCKEDCSKPPSYFWDGQYTEDNDNYGQATRNNIIADLGPRTVGADYGITKNYRTLGEKPWGKCFSKYWELSGKASGTIPPGRGLQYTAKLARHSCRYFDVGSDNPNLYIHGFSKVVMLIYHGQYGCTSITDDTIVSTSDCMLQCRRDIQFGFYGGKLPQTRRLIMGITGDMNAQYNIYANIPIGEQQFGNVMTDERTLYDENL